jgi:hypothetical protein
MALWGNKDAVAIAGTTVSVTNGSKAVTGSGTTFTTDLQVGSIVEITSGTSTKNRVASITSDTALTLSDNFSGTTAGTLAIASVTKQLMPKNVYRQSTGGTYGTRKQTNLATIVGVDITEAQTSSNIAKGITTPGWTRFKTYTDSSGNTRRKVEVLVAGNGYTLATMSDAVDDTIVADRSITIGTQPASIASAATPYTGTFTVAATATNSGSLTYQWRVSTDAGVTFNNVTNAGVYTGATTATLTLTAAAKATYNNYQYRCAVSATGADTVTSTAATLVYA